MFLYNLARNNIDLITGFVMPLVLLVCLLFSTSVFAANSEQEWGIAGVIRSATVPFINEHGDDYVNSFVPMLFFQGETFYLDGLEGGAKLYTHPELDYNVFALLRSRFVDIPRFLQNEAGGDSADFGFQVQVPTNDHWDIEVELMSDSDYYLHSNLVFSGDYTFGDWQLEPQITFRLKSQEFNSQYYAFESVTGESINGGLDVTATVRGKYHVVSNLYLLGSVGATYLDSSAYDAAVIDERWQGEVYAGIAFFNDKNTPKRESLSISPYLRLAYGWATPSNMGDILFGFESEKDENEGTLSSIFYGYPLTDELFGLDFDIYLTPGLVHHWTTDAQGASTEYVVAIKAYYTLDWPTKWRIGVAEGLSYIDRITYVEGKSMTYKGYEPSQLLNYLDVSFDVNLGDLFSKRDWNNLWLGYSLHHRSAIFESSSQFGRIKGGSNYNTVYLQVDF
ncbi:MipA/OmpV family protein [Vibrio sp. kj40-1]|uniref:MipA/OmpV family protein n=2 Tax=Vibrio algarum TaxID=3020714 RepID=A0ABT4YPM1_9VIBR|nr:MipA/OmpV family protein [Vibrio sp. KJ40-1]